MTKQEQLEHAKAEFDRIMDSLLLAAQKSQTVFARSLTDLPRVTADYRHALIAAASSAPQEVGEDYMKAAYELQTHVVFLITVLNEHLQRQHASNAIPDALRRD
jgi:hypothetical protein